jgi:hypothetical protein
LTEEPEGRVLADLLADLPNQAALKAPEGLPPELSAGPDSNLQVNLLEQYAAQTADRGQPTMPRYSSKASMVTAMGLPQDTRLNITTRTVRPALKALSNPTCTLFTLVFTFQKFPVPRWHVSSRRWHEGFAEGGLHGIACP